MKPILMNLARSSTIWGPAAAIAVFFLALAAAA